MTNNIDDLKYSINMDTILILEPVEGNDVKRRK